MVKFLCGFEALCLYSSAVQLHVFCIFGDNSLCIRQSDNGNFRAAATRERSAALAAGSAKSADIKCQFGGLLPHIRLPFRREIVTNCESCVFCAISESKKANPYSS
jgi:hypothetical protein